MESKTFQLQGKFLCCLFPLSSLQEAFHRKLKSLLKILVVLILGKPFLSLLHLHGNSECDILNIKSYCSS